jgi:hypothetical protein
LFLDGAYFCGETVSQVSAVINVADWFDASPNVAIHDGMTKIAQIKGTNDLRTCSKNSKGEVHFIQTFKLDELKQSQELLFNMDKSDSKLNLYTDFKTSNGSVWFTYPKPTPDELSQPFGGLKSNKVLSVPTNDL